MVGEYVLSETNNPLDIAEREYASAPKKIQFTAFTSCIGVVARKGDKLTGVHLSQVDNNDKYFGEDRNVVTSILNKLPNPADRVTIFGFVKSWRNSENTHIKQAYGRLTGLLKERVGQGLEVYHEAEVVDDGAYSAEIGGLDGILIKIVR